MTKKIFSGLCCLVLLASASAIAHATSITYKLTEDGCSGTCGVPTSLGTGVFAKVTLTQDGSNVDVKEVLATGENYAGTGAGDALEFNATGVVASDIVGLTSGFEAGPFPDTASTFGSFLDSVTCNYSGGACHGGNGPAGPLTFTVDNAVLADFTFNSGGNYFSSDIYGVNGKTGNVGGNTAGVLTPEPSSLLLLGTGIVGAAGLLRRRIVLKRG